MTTQTYDKKIRRLTVYYEADSLYCHNRVNV